MATANVKRYIVKDVDARNYVSAFQVPTGKVFVLSGVWTYAEDTVYMKITTVTGETTVIADSNDELNRMFRGLVLDSQDIVEVKFRSSGTTGDVVIAGELFDKANE